MEFIVVRGSDGHEHSQMVLKIEKAESKRISGHSEVANL